MVELLVGCGIGTVAGQLKPMARHIMVSRAARRLSPEGLLYVGIMAPVPLAGVAELVDAPDSKSGSPKGECRFEPDLRYLRNHRKAPSMVAVTGAFSYWGEETPFARSGRSRSPPIADGFTLPFLRPSLCPAPPPRTSSRARTPPRPAAPSRAPASSGCERPTPRAGGRALSPPVRVHPPVLRVDPPLVEARQGLRRERLVELDEAHVFHGDAGPFERLPRGRHRPYPHHPRRHPGDRRALDPGHRREAVCPCVLRGDHHDRPGPAAFLTAAALAPAGDVRGGMAPAWSSAGRASVRGHGPQP